MTFIGSYLFQLDEKGRVSLPASFRREAGEQPFVLLQVREPALTLYPHSVWQKVAEELRGVQREKKWRLSVLKLLANAVEAVPDSQGRILVPSRLQEVAGLQGQVLLVGGIDKVELWNPRTFDEAEVEAAEFAAVVDNIFP